LRVLRPEKSMTKNPMRDVFPPFGYSRGFPSRLFQRGEARPVPQLCSPLVQISQVDR
jgi:hypothetical protein